MICIDFLCFAHKRENNIKKPRLKFKPAAFFMGLDFVIEVVQLFEGMMLP